MNHEEQRPLIVAIDDSDYYLRELEYELIGNKVDLISFHGPTDFETEAKSEDINRAKLILVDYDFKTCTAEDRDLSGFIREKFPKFQGKVVLLTLLDDFLRGNQLLEKSYDATLSKIRDFSWDKIQPFIL